MKNTANLAHIITEAIFNSKFNSKGGLPIKINPKVQTQTHTHNNADPHTLQPKENKNIFFLYRECCIYIHKKCNKVFLSLL